MPSSRPSPNPNAGKGLERAMQLGMDLVRQAREAAKANVAPTSRDRQMAEAHRAALVRYEGQVRQHQGRIAGAKAGMVVGGAGTAVLGLSTVASAPSPGTMVFLGGLTAGSAALGWRARSRAKALEAHPPVPQLPPLPPARLRPGSRGADQADRVANALLHLYDLVPNVGRLYPQAGQELWRAVSDVEPLLRGQVERLTSLDRIEWEMPGSRAADAAVAAGTEIASRLHAGADALEDLIAAAARMLAAPDIGDGVPDALAPAIVSLDAFAHGLNAANAARLGGL
ncbi:MAG TPA: hypothetical protein VES02_02665 [Dermatophilaceae bacterium]|nr:hypothetical protein [Dermatophilaceae bacterium]